MNQPSNINTEQQKENCTQNAVPVASCAPKSSSPCTCEQEEKVELGITWSYLEVLRGKSAVILMLTCFILFAFVGIVNLFVTTDEMSLGSILASTFKDLLTLKAEKLAQDLSMLIVFFSPAVLILWPIVALILMAAYNIRDCKLPRTEFNLRMHDFEASRAWNWTWSIMVGIIDFNAVFYIIVQGLAMCESFMSSDVKTVLTVLATVVCLVFAERRVYTTSTRMASRHKGNYDLACCILDGELDSILPEDKRNPVSRAKVATLVRLGIFRTPTMACRIVDGIDLRTKVKLFSGFLNSTIHGILSAVSFGIAARVANELGDVGGQYASGHGEELVAHLKTRDMLKPHFIIEIFALLLCIFWTTFEFFIALLEFL